MKNVVKRIAALALATAVTALCVSCGDNKDPQMTTNNIVISTEVQEVRADVLSKQELDASQKLNGVVKTMINDENLYGSNFDHYVENVIVTGINVEAIEDGVLMDYSPFSTASANKAKVTVAYVADAISKATGEKSSVSNVISFVVNNGELATIAQNNTQEVDYVELVEKVADSAVAKLQNEGVSEEDQVSGRQSNISNVVLKDYVSRQLEAYYELPEIKKYLDDGYTLITTSQPSPNGGYSTYVAYREQKLLDEFPLDKVVDFNTPNARISLEIHNNNQETIGIYYTLVTVAINNETGDTRLIYQGVLDAYVLDGKTVNSFIDYAKSYSIIDIDKIIEDAKAKGNGLLDVTEIICGEEAFTNEFYSMLNGAMGNSSQNFVRWNWLTPFSDVDANEVNNYADKVNIMALLNENNTEVFIKEPTR